MKPFKSRYLVWCDSLAPAAGPAAASFQAHRIAGPAHAVKLDRLHDGAVWAQAPLHDTFDQNRPNDKISEWNREEETGILTDLNFYLHLEREADRNGDAIGVDHAPGAWMRGPYDTACIDGEDRAESGCRLYTERALQLNGIYHFGPRDTIRMILQKARITRNPALYAFPVAATSSSGTSSFFYGHTAGLEHCCISRTHPVRWRYARLHAEAPPKRIVRQTLLANLSNVKETHHENRL